MERLEDRRLPVLHREHDEDGCDCEECGGNGQVWTLIAGSGWQYVPCEACSEEQPW